MQIERHAFFWTVAAFLFAYLVQLLAPVLLPFVIGLLLAYFFDPVVNTLRRIGLPRWASSILLLTLLIFLVVLGLIFLVPILVQQAAGLVEAAPRQIDRLKVMIEAGARDYLGPRYPQAEGMLRSALDSFTSSAPSLLGGVAKSIWNQGAAAFNFVSFLLITPVVFFYTLRDWPKIVAKVDSWLPRDSVTQLRALAIEIDERVSAFIRGQGAVCIILALYYAATLSFAGLEYGLLVGLFTGLAAFIPIFGWSIGAFTAVSLAILQFWPDYWSILIVVAIMLVGQALESAVLSPSIIGSEVGLHPVWLIFALLTFSYLFGFLGLLVAVPVSAAIGVLVRFALKTYLESSVYKGERAEV
ncbi:AI-2E family transporter [Hyphomicrobium sp.]|jgi:predicted PurR-regulated permease PerM|uniref:AI-2E family transporter n=1 Tax=Hyphomicrobium sp. TaxID=82 RepID=UPI002C0D972D|nr:AI-2E family transporter [Hyphomicrobium sp.]HVZ06122.1 AI-2E family transporter [Hyphomicrobium sp.]